MRKSRPNRLRASGVVAGRRCRIPVSPEPAHSDRTREDGTAEEVRIVPTASSMRAQTGRARVTLAAVLSGMALAGGAYAATVVATWWRYGRPPSAEPADQDSLLDGFMPRYETVERHRIDVHAPADVTLAVATRMDLNDSPIVRAIFRTRELVLGAVPERRPRYKGLLDEVLSLGWVVLHEVPHREVVVGAVTRPWEPDTVFRSVPPGDFAAFAEPGYVKIAWTLRADPVDGTRCVFRTETRATTTDADARARFRWYWARFSPGIWLIRRLTLRPLRRAAERLAGPA